MSRPWLTPCLYIYRIIVTSAMLRRFSVQNSVRYDRTLPRLTPLGSRLIRGWLAIEAVPDTYVFWSTPRYVFEIYHSLDLCLLCTPVKGRWRSLSEFRSSFDSLKFVAGSLLRQTHKLALTFSDTSCQRNFYFSAEWQLSAKERLLQEPNCVFFQTLNLRGRPLA